MRQFRVESDSCDTRRFTSLGSRYDNKDQKSCYAEYRAEASDVIGQSATASFTPFGTMKNVSCKPLVNVSVLDRPFCIDPSSGQVPITGKYGYGKTLFGSVNYGKRGFSAYLSNKQDAHDKIDYLWKHKWIDFATRAVDIEVVA